MNTMSTNTMKRRNLIMIGAFILMLALVLTIVPSFAASGNHEVPEGLSGILDSLIFYIGLIFRVVGILLAVYAIGQMIMAFKDENPDAKTKSATLLVVSIILICLPSIIQSMGLADMITGNGV